MPVINVGDLVRYRQWEPGDPTVMDVPKDRRGWGDQGIVVEIEDWFEHGQRLPNQGILFLNQKSEFILARTKDLEIIEHVQKLQIVSKAAL
jgi:hypothetical protein